MTSFLYECLREVGLQRYYPQFSDLGFSNPAQLSKLTMSDYPQLGVHHMEDRTRLFYLVQIMKALGEEQKDEYELHDDEEEQEVMVDPIAPPRRRLYFGPPSPEPQLDFLTQDGKTNTCVGKTHRNKYTTQTGKEEGSCHTPIVAVNSRHKARTSIQTSKRSSWTNVDAWGCNIYKDSKTPHKRKTKEQIQCLKEIQRKALIQQDSTPLYKVKHIAGYNYGLPNSSPAPSTRAARGVGVDLERIRVCVRKRPLSRSEERRGDTDVVVAQNRECVMICEKKEAVDLSQYVLQHEFYYDEVFSEACTNEDVYLKTAGPLIQHIFSGGKATCFAYGQTGAGKTYTMLGSPQRPGLYALAGRDIFAQLKKPFSEPRVTRHPGAPFVFVSFFEIYCGQLYDLLDHRKRLFAREDRNHVVQVVGLREVRVESVDTLLEVISYGSQERRQGASSINCDSSRSHALLQIHLRDPKHQLIGRISFVDLAGSERAADTREPDRKNRIEGAEINQSLLALKECIRALDQEHIHTPFRQSKLTQVLKDSFTGNSKTCMIANISPSHLATEHTLNTLRYADRVKEIRKGDKSLLGLHRRSSKYSGSLSPKHGKNSRGKSPLKRIKSKGYTTCVDDRVSTCSPVRMGFPTGDALVCSTPKFTAEKENHGQQAEFFLDHTTPVRGTLKDGMNKDSREWEKRRVAKETKKNLGQHQATSGEKAKRAGKRPGGHRVHNSICCKNLKDSLFVEEEFTGDQDISVINIEKEKKNPMECRGKTEDQMREWEHQKERQKEETDAVKHLRRYHQQLQQLPSPTNLLSGKLGKQPLLNQLGMKKAEVLNPAVIQGIAFHCTPKIAALVCVGEDKNTCNHLCEDCSEADIVFKTRSGGQPVMTAWNTKDCLFGGVLSQQVLSSTQDDAEVIGSSQESLSSYQLDFSRYHAGPEILLESRWKMLGGKMESLGVDLQDNGSEQLPSTGMAADDIIFKKGLQLPVREECDSSERDLGKVVQSNTNGLRERGTEEEHNGVWNTCGLSESSNGSCKVVMGEKPFSSSDCKTVINPEDHNDISSDLKAVNHGVQDKVGTRIHINDTSDCLSHCVLKDNTNNSEPSCSSDKVQTTQWTRVVESTTSLFSSEMFLLGQPSSVVSSKTEVRESPDPETVEMSQEVTGMNGDMPLVSTDNSPDTSACTSTTMGPLSVSMLDVDRQTATDSIFQHDCNPPCICAWGGKEGFEEEESLVFAEVSKTINYPKCAREFNGHTKEQWSFMDPSLFGKNGHFLETATQHGREIQSDITVSSGGVPKQDHNSAKQVQVDVCRETVDLEFAQNDNFSKLHAAGSKEMFLSLSCSIESKNVGQMGNRNPSDAVHSSGVVELGLSGDVLKDGYQEESPHSTRQDTMSAAEPNTAIVHRIELGEAQRFVVEAHCEQLAKMESLCRREEALLNLQPNLDFKDYVLMLEEIMELQAQCVHSMRLQLDLYLTPKTQSSHTD
ncbi:kinesin-like protein KIF24 [Arapaima gigas]